MNNRQINRILKQNIITRGVFVSVHAADTLPPRARSKKPCAYVCNLDYIAESGSHWVCMYFPSSSPVEYFDSYGFPPKKEFEDFMGQNFVRSRKFIQQASSTVCGQYVISYIFLRCSGYSMLEIVNLFSEKHLLVNDLFVNAILKTHFASNFVIYDTNFLRKL